MTAGNAPDRPVRGIILVLVAALLFACMDGVNKSLVADYSTAQILWIRYLFLLLFALAVARRRGLRTVIRSARVGLQAGRSLLLILEKATFVLAWSYLTLADTHAIAAISPLIVTLFAGLILREQIGLSRSLAVAAGFVGVMLIIRPGMGVMSYEALIPLAAAALFAAYQLMTRAVSRGDEADTSLLYVALVGAVLLTAIGPFSWYGPTPGDWALLLLVAVLGAGAHFCLIAALNYAPASTLQPFGYSLFLWATVVGFIGFGDLPDLWTVTGGGVVILSGLYAIRAERRETVANGSLKPRGDDAH